MNGDAELSKRAYSPTVAGAGWAVRCGQEPFIVVPRLNANMLLLW